MLRPRHFEPILVSLVTDTWGPGEQTAQFRPYSMPGHPEALKMPKVVGALPLQTPD